MTRVQDLGSVARRSDRNQGIAPDRTWIFSVLCEESEFSAHALDATKCNSPAQFWSVLTNRYIVRPVS